MKNNLLEIKNLSIRVAGQDKKIVDSVNLDIATESIVALVGGSGSGKSTTGLSIMRLLDPALEIESGSISFENKNILSFSNYELRKIRGAQIGMVFQEPLTAFNPVFTIGYQIDEVLQIHTQYNHEHRIQRTKDLLDLVGLPDPNRVIKNYPHQLSGGMRQRAMIAQAIAANPKLLIADEPTSSLDVTLQARIMELFKKISKELRLSILLITHDLDMVRHMAEYTFVMTQGKIVESGKTQDILNQPKVEYTRQLMQAFKV